MSLYKNIVYYKPAVCDKNVWFSSITFNGLFHMDVDNDILEYLAPFSIENLCETNMFSMTIKISNYLVCVPFVASKIAIYNLISEECEYLDLPHASVGCSSFFYQALVEGDSVFLIPCRYKYIVEVKTKSKELIEYDVFDELLKQSEPPYVYKGACKIADKIYLGLSYENKLLEYNLKQRNIKEILLPYDINGVTDIFYNENMWIVGRCGKLIEYEMDGEHFKEYVLAETTETLHYGIFFESVIIGSNLYLSRSDVPEIVVFDMKENTLQSVRLHNEKKSSLLPVCIPTIYQVGNDVHAIDDVGVEYVLRDVGGVVTIYEKKKLTIDVLLSNLKKDRRKHNLLGMAASIQSIGLDEFIEGVVDNSLGCMLFEENG